MKMMKNTIQALVILMFQTKMTHSRLMMILLMMMNLLFLHLKMTS